MNLVAALAPVALQAVGSLFSSGKKQEDSDSDSKYKAIAEMAMERMAMGGMPGSMPQGQTQSYTLPPTAMQQMQAPQYMQGMPSFPSPSVPQFIPQAAQQFQQSYQESGNPIYAGYKVAQSLYKNRGEIGSGFMDTIKGIGSFAKGLLSKFWDNKGEILGDVLGALTKKPRLV